MVNIVSCYMSMLHKIMKLAGMHPKEVEIEPGTVIHFWVNNNNDNDDDDNNAKKKSRRRPALVLIHGFAGDGILTWQFQVLALRKKYSLYIPDLLFFGGSHTTSKAKITPRFHADCFAKGLRKLGVEEKCVVVGFSYGGFVGFQMAEHHPELVDSMVVTGSVLALSESISSKSLERIGFSSWPDYLMPNSVEGVKVLLDIGSYSFPWMPKVFYKHYLEVMFGNRKERVELLEALVVKDEDVTNHQFKQRIHLLWGNEDEIFNLEEANNLKGYDP
ncbi:1-acylglycerol-3-phosphate O-acyltransferase isoform X2 [Spinacia oleracea]|uniref:1-acylglycerol-3-phosphate O-acyltransferase isoform X2 n=1 Tax=Spinacia oleracea TaxID=3562 RepID=A0ABM3RQX6_SPIOL|nr:1-acylglycerol-3-phosphate O-acyltransferase-like isoform X2 [Spinacia oleracea]